MTGKALSFLIAATVLMVPIFINTSISSLQANEMNSLHSISHTFSFNAPSYKTIGICGEEFTRLQLDDLPLYGNSGEPRIPVKPLRILLPHSTKVKNIFVETSKAETFEIHDFKQVELGVRSFPLNQKPEDWDIPQLCSEEQTYPNELYQNVGVQYFRGYSILHVNLHPMQYVTNTNTFFYYDEMILTIETEQTDPNSLYRASLEDEKELIEILDSSDVLESYRGVYALQSASQYDYVIITTENLKNANGEYSFDDLIIYRENQGLSCTYKTVEDIQNEYDGVDTQEKIRNFIKDAYLNWGTTWVLIGGDTQKVPIRYLDDFDGEDGEVSSDLYYQCLDGNYNYDGDDSWGEMHDGIDGNRVDLYAEVYIGRAPVDDETDVSAFVEKTLSYENSKWGEDKYLKNHLSAGEYTWSGPGGWGAGYVERCIDHCSDYDQDTYGLPSSIFSINKLYERDASWTKTDAINAINNGVGIINHVGHGSYIAAMKIFNSDVSALNNIDKYGLFYSQACHSGEVEKFDCIAEEWVNAEKSGGFAAIMNSGVGYGSATGYDGTDNRYSREFFDALFSSQEKISEIGKANQDSKQDNFYRIDETNMHMYHVYYDTLLFGDPYVRVKGSEGTIAEFTWIPHYPKTGESILFSDMSTGNIIYREWNFGDGSYSHVKNVSHSYSLEKTYSVTLSIWDDEGYMSSITHDIEVRNHWSPIPVMYYGYNGENELTIDFDGADSWDPDGTIVSYEWDFDDGTTSNEVNPTHEFPSEDDYNVRLMVIDNEDNIGVEYCSVVIENIQSPEKPNAPSGPTSGIERSKYAFVATTNDPGENIIKYGWDWGDGSPVEWSKYYTSGEQCMMIHAWESSGSYNVRVIAKNLPGVESNWSDSLVVVMIENDAPLVEITKPTRALYVNNNKILPFFSSVIIGDIDIEATAVDGGGVDKVEFYIDGELMADFTSEPYVLNWNEHNVFGVRHIIKVVAYDNSGEQGISELTVWRIFSGIFWKNPV